MARIIEWGEMESSKSQPDSGGGGGGNIFMILKEGKNKIRLYGKSLMMHAVWIKRKRYIVPESYIDRIESLGLKTVIHYAINCLDREDTENNIFRFKILERGKMVFDNFKTYYDNMEDDEGNKTDPAGKNGPDWLITVSTPRDDARRRTYTVMALKNEPLKREEKELIMRTKYPDANKTRPLGERGLVDLMSFFKVAEAAERLEEALKDYAKSGPDETEEETPKDKSAKQQEQPVKGKKKENERTIENVPGPEDMDETELDKLLDNTF